MKRNLFITTISLLVATVATAQGVSRMYGLIGGSPQANHTSNGYLFSTDSSGMNFRLEYDFPVAASGGLPANLEMAPYNGKLYGTTSQGGTSNLGTIFEYDPVTNTYTKKVEFGTALSITGGVPKGSLLLYNGKFYGLMEGYGVSGSGVLFEWDPATNIYTKKFDFTGNSGAYPGSYPQNSLRLYNGKMYGTTQAGGASGLGVVFEWDPVTGVYRSLFECNGTNGWGFYTNITGYNNKLYCVSHQGGTNGYGSFLEIDPLLPAGSNTVILKQFDNSTGGLGSNNEIIVYNNKLYGCLSGGGTNARGTMFEYNPATTTFTKLMDFEYSSTGGNPQGRLIPNGVKFLGLCSGGGINGTGTVYEWDPANPTTVLKRAEFGPNTFTGPINPGSTLVFYSGRFYAVTYNGGFTNRGTLFEYDYSTNNITKKLNFDVAETGRIPYGKPLLLNGKLYGTCSQGPQEIFGTPYGSIWSYDPATGIYSPKVVSTNLNYTTAGRGFYTTPVAFNGKIYGTTTNGGSGDGGVFYEYDPATDIYTTKDFAPTSAAYSASEPVVYNNKLYGVVNNGGAANAGIIYCYDPATGTLSKIYDINSIGAKSPESALTVYNNKLYGTTTSGGSNNQGVIYAFDPATGTAAKLYDLNTSTGITIRNALLVYNNKLYNTAFAGGAQGRGCIFMFDPSNNTATNVYSFLTNTGEKGYDPYGGLTLNGNKMYCLTRYFPDNDNYLVEFDPATNTASVRSIYNSQSSPVTYNGLTVLPAFIAAGFPNSCETYPTIIIDATNTNKWVPVLNSNGDVVAEIKANGNILGNVTISAYINNGTTREDPAKRLYMDRNITITPQNAVTGLPVDLRLYVKSNEYLALKNAVNSGGQPSGINSINDIAVFKNEQNCGGLLTANATRLSTTPENYEYGYVLKTSVSSFSTFFFAKNTFSILPTQLISFAATPCSNGVCLLWVTENEQNFDRYELEKSTNGVHYQVFATKAANNTGGRNTYTGTDQHPAAGVNYYRLKMIDKDGTTKYSHIVTVDISSPSVVRVHPNPATNIVVLEGVSRYNHLRLADMSGRVKWQQLIRNDIETVDIRQLPAGIYILQLINDKTTMNLKLVKQ